MTSAGAVVETDVELSIIIVSWNVRDVLHACLTSLQQHPFTGGRTEIHVIDNASIDGTPEMLATSFPEVRATINKENVGFARANNQALPMCRGPYLLLLNPDTEVRSGALDCMVAYMRANSDVGLAGCRLVNSDGSFQRDAGGAFPTLLNVCWHQLKIDAVLPQWLSPPRLFIDRDPGDADMAWISGAVMLLRREEVGERIFDETIFMFGEDMELCWQVHQRGQRVVRLAEPVIMHHHGRSMESQQSDDIQALVVKGPRTFYAMHCRGRFSLWLYDVLVFCGYLLRWTSFSVLALVRPALRRRAAESRRFMGVSLAHLCGR